MSVERLNRFVRKTSIKKKMRFLICCVAALSTISFMYYSFSSSVQESDKILHRQLRGMKPMIDMRGFADREGLCPNAGYFRNKTDCTQFYRCVDFNRNGKHTVFRFMCGPGTAFDQRRSVCVLTKMAVPECRMTPNPTSDPPTSMPDRPTPTPDPPTPTPDPPTPDPPTPDPPTPTPNTPTPTPDPPTPDPPTPTPDPPTPTPNPPISTTDPPTPTSAPNTPTPTPDPSVLPTPTPNVCKGIFKVEDEYFHQPVTSQNLSISPYSISGIVSCGDRNQIVVIQNGSKKTINLPSGTISSIISTNESYGIVTNISNNIFTTNSTKFFLPPYTTYEIIQFVEGQGVNRTTLFVTQGETTEILVPEMSIYGEVMLRNNQVSIIGGWSFTTEYITIDETKSLSATFGIISNVSTLQTAVSTNSNGFENSKQFISGIITVGGSVSDYFTNSSLTYILSVTNEDLLVIIPNKGKGTISVIEEQPRNVTEFLITPGTVLTIQPPTDLKGMVTNLLQPMYTSATTDILFPAGSTVSVNKIRIDGKLEKISAVQVSSTFAVSTITQSIIGIAQTSNDGFIKKIGNAYIEVKLANGSLDETYVGILNFNSILRKEDQSISGLIHIGDPNVLNYQQSSTVQTILIRPESYNAILFSGEMIITEEYDTFIKQNVVSIPSGKIIGIITRENGGEISGISNGYFTTNSTQLVFPFGVQFGAVLISSFGSLLAPQNPFETTVKTTITVPVGSIFGGITMIMSPEKGVMNKIGNAYFSTQYLVIDQVLLPVPTTQLSIFGVIYFDEQFDLPKSIATSSTKFNGQLQTISAIFHVPARNYSDFYLIDSLSVLPGSSLAIIPNTGQGVVTVNDGNSSFDFAILPGQMFGFFSVQDAKITYIRDGFFTTKTTSISFGSETMYGIVKIGLDASIFAVEFKRALSDMSITVTEGSTVGKLDFIDSDGGRQTVVSIGGAPFAIRNLTSTSTQTSANGAIGIIGINDLPPTSTSATPTTIYYDDTATTRTPGTTTTTTPGTITTTTTPETTTRTPKPPPKPFTIDCTSDSTIYQYPLDCSRFYQCVTEGDKRDIYVLPCLPGLYFDQVSSSCRNQNETICTDPTSINATISSGGLMHLYCNENFYRYPLNCNSFYTCLKDDEGLAKISIFSCVAGLVFDDSSYNCLLPNETLPCDANENLFKSPSIGFQLGEKIDAASLLSTSRGIFEKQKTRNLSKHGELSDRIVPKLPYQNGRRASQRKSEIHVSTKLRSPS